jgi:hypothetical protein
MLTIITRFCAEAAAAVKTIHTTAEKIALKYIAEFSWRDYGDVKIKFNDDNQMLIFIAWQSQIGSDRDLEEAGIQCEM